MDALRDAGSIPAASIFYFSKLFEIKNLRVRGLRGVTLNLSSGVST